MLSRRTVLAAGAAWSVPVIALAAGAPAYAASPCGPDCPTMGYGGGTSLGGWVLSTTGTLSADGVLGWQADFDGLSDAFAVSKDPEELGTSVSYVKSLCLSAGTTYTFSASYVLDVGSQRIVSLRGRILDDTGALVEQIGTRIASGAGAVSGIGVWSGDYTPTTTGFYGFEWLVTFGETNPTFPQPADDVGVQAPTVTCSP